MSAPAATSSPSRDGHRAARAGRPEPAAAAPAPADRSAAASRCSARRSSPPSPTSTRATSRRTSRPARSSATCSSGSSSWPTSWRWSCSTCRRRRGWRRGATSPSCAARAFRARSTCFLWVQAEIVAIATDLAEFVGAAIGAAPAVRHRPVSGRADHRRRRVRDPRARAARLPALRAGDHRPAGARRARLPLRLRRRRQPRRGGHRRRPACRASAAPRRCCWRWGSSARRSCRTSSTCTRR